MRKLQSPWVITFCALVLAAWTFWHAHNRERRLIEKYEPRISSLYEDFGISPPLNPQTLDDLLDPLAKLIEDLQQ
jgi:hypothetical protein